MDHDHEIMPGTGSADNKVRLFLRDSLNAIRQDEQTAYDLEEEFAKTGKTRDWFVVGIISLVVVVMVAAAWIVTSRINESSRNVKVDIAVFEDLNLKNVLDLAKKAEDSLNAVIDERSSVQADYQGELYNLQLQRKSEQDLLAAKHISAADRAKRKAEITRLYDKKEKDLKASYSANFAVLDAKMDDAKKQVESFDKKRVDEARAQKQLLDNQSNLFELEQKKLTTKYETEIADLRKRMDDMQRENSKLKTTQITDLMNEYQGQLAALDPLFQDADADSLVAAAGVVIAPAPAGTAAAPVEGSPGATAAPTAPASVAPAPDGTAAGSTDTVAAPTSVAPAPAVASVVSPELTLPFRNVPKNIPDGFNFSSADFKQITRDYDGVQYLLSKVAAIPYTNESGGYIVAARNLALQAGDTGEKVIHAAFSQLAVEKQKRLDAEASAIAADMFQKALTDSAVENGYAGYVISAVNQEAPALFLLPDALAAVFAAEKPEVFVYRGSRTLVTTLTLSRTKAGAVTAAIAEGAKKKDMKPMDYIELKKK